MSLRPKTSPAYGCITGRSMHWRNSGLLRHPVPVHRSQCQLGRSPRIGIFSIISKCLTLRMEAGFSQIPLLQLPITSLRHNDVGMGGRPAITARVQAQLRRNSPSSGQLMDARRQRAAIPGRGKKVHGALPFRWKSTCDLQGAASEDAVKGISQRGASTVPLLATR